MRAASKWALTFIRAIANFYHTMYICQEYPMFACKRKFGRKRLATLNLAQVCQFQSTNDVLMRAAGKWALMFISAIANFTSRCRFVHFKYMRHNKHYFHRYEIFTESVSDFFLLLCFLLLPSLLSTVNVLRWNLTLMADNVLTWTMTPCWRVHTALIINRAAFQHKLASSVRWPWADSLICLYFLFMSDNLNKQKANKKLKEGYLHRFYK